MTSAESLLVELSASDPLITELIAETGPLLVPFDTLTDIDGWVVDLGGESVSVPFDDPALPPVQRAVNALLVASDYAVRRGASDVADAIRVLRRESPVAVAGIERAPRIGPVVDRTGRYRGTRATGIRSAAERASPHG